MIKGWDHLPHKERLREPGVLILEKAQGDLTNVQKYLMDGSKQSQAFLRGVLSQDKRQWAQNEMWKNP